jgi:hypothetical protein
MTRGHRYQLATGQFTGETFGTNLESASEIARFFQLNSTPDLGIYVADVIDPLSQCVDIQSGQVIDYQPPTPGADYAWNADTKRWQLSTAVQAKQAASTTALAQIAALEAKGVRAMRELALGTAGAADRLAAIDAQIVVLRANL